MDLVDGIGGVDAIEAILALLAGVEIESVDAGLVPVAGDAADLDASLALDVVAIDVGDAERLLFEPGALDSRTDSLLYG